MAVDCSESSWVVDRKRVGRKAYDRSVLGVQVQEVDVFVPTVGVVQVWQRGQTSEERAWVRFERVNVEPVAAQSE